MTPVLWAGVLQWSRVGISAVLFLGLARAMTLEDIGAFAVAVAPLRALQVFHRPGIVDVAVVSPDWQSRLHAVSLFGGVVMACGLTVAGLVLGGRIGMLILLLAPTALATAAAAVPEAVLRQRLRIRALAIRTLLAQGIAMAVALWLGAGAVSLAVFALLGAVLSCAMTLILTGFPRPQIAGAAAVMPAVFRITARDLGQAALLPVLHILTASVLGLPAAGALQLAGRVMSLADTLAVAPLRFVLLPRLADARRRSALGQELGQSMSRALALSGPVYLAVLLLAPAVLPQVVGGDNYAGLAPLLPWFCLLGFMAAVAMPLVQTATAVGLTALAMRRSLSLTAVSLVLAAAAMPWGAAAVAGMLPLAYLITLFPFAARVLACTGDADRLTA